MYDNNGLSDNFSSRLKSIRKKEELVNRDLYPEEVTQILDELKKSNYFVYTAFFLLTTTGLRIEEIATAKWADLVFHSSLNAYLLRVVGKGIKVGKFVSLKIHWMLYAMFEVYVNKQQN